VTSTTLTLWPEAAPSTHPASIDFDTTADSVFGFLASASSELLIATGNLTAHLDRPLDASGTRIPFSSTGKLAFVMLLHTQGSTLAFAFATQSDDGPPSLSLALENALLRVQSPSILAAGGQIDADRFLNCAVGLVFPLQWILPTLPDPYAASFDASLVEDRDGANIGILTATTTWDGASVPGAVLPDADRVAWWSCWLAREWGLTAAVAGDREKWPAWSSASRVRVGRLIEFRVVDDRDRVEADLCGDPGQQLVLRSEMALHVRHLVEGGARIIEGRFRALVRGGGLHVLPDHDDRQQHQLQEGLRHPRDDRRRAATDRVREADQVEQCKGVGTPHAADHLRD
jgi:hypothetical protein